MKTTILIIISFLTRLWIAEPQEQDLEIAINESDFVGFVIYDDNSSITQLPILMATEVFKGDVKVLSLRKVELEIDEAKEYLLVAKKDGGIVTKIVYPIKPAENLSKEILDILSNLPCYNELLEKEYQNKACHRDLDPVCGCDNIEYGNICEMRRHGITKFKPGRCP